eukprot:GFYU01009901.1.p1 GENE.GFYU01009901.1~~GFYU01009901.1.p1  ORF type:complete len:532 (-),score=121.60 GFYU01009901.1:218-1813(-)
MQKRTRSSQRIAAAAAGDGSAKKNTAPLRESPSSKKQKTKTARGAQSSKKDIAASSTTQSSAGDVIDLAQKLQRLRDWLLENGGFTTGLSLRVRDNGSEAVADRDISAGEVLLGVPRKCILTPAVAVASPLGQMVRKVCPEATQRYILYLYLIAERFHRDAWDTYMSTLDKSGNAFTSFRPYIDILPTEFSDPLSWSEEELNHIRGTNLGLSLDSLRGSIQDVYDGLVPPLTKHNPTLFPDDVFSVESFTWARSAFLSRSFPQVLLYSKEEEAELNLPELDGILVPYMDSLNHEYGKKVTWIPTHVSKSGCLEMQSDAQYNAGENVSQNYGAKSNEQLILGYGFCLEDNQMDDVALRIGYAIQDSELRDRKVDLLQRGQLVDIHYWVVNSPLPCPSLMKAMHVLSAYDEEDFECISDATVDGDGAEAEAEAGLTFRMDEYGLVDGSLETKLNVVSQLDELLKMKIKGLGGKDDEAFHVELLNTASLTQNAQNAIVYRVGQHKILQQASTMVKRIMRKLEVEYEKQNPNVEE